MFMIFLNANYNGSAKIAIEIRAANHNMGLVCKIEFKFRPYIPFQCMSRKFATENDWLLLSSAIDVR